jgi:hypothetical protein
MCTMVANGPTNNTKPNTNTCFRLLLGKPNGDSWSIMPFSQRLGLCCMILHHNLQGRMHEKAVNAPRWRDSAEFRLAGTLNTTALSCRPIQTFCSPLSPRFLFLYIYQVKFNLLPLFKKISTVRLEPSSTFFEPFHIEVVRASC